MANGKNSALRGLAVVTILSLAWGCSFLSGEQADQQAAPPHDILIEPAGSSKDLPSSEPGEMILYPSESIAYEKYLDVIKGRPGLADTAVIEATITSVLKSEICPYQEETCRIEPYPDDWGVVKVERILEYRPHGAQAQEPVAEQPVEAPASEGETTASYTGAGGQPQPEDYEPLQPGQEVEAQFLLTARPAKVRWVVALGSEGMQVSKASDTDPEQTAEQQVGPETSTFEPIPKEGDAFVFHLLSTDPTESDETALPGLAAGSRFRATVHYNGTLYVQGYQVIP